MSLNRKSLAIGIILLFFALTINPITGSVNTRDDITPPVTTISLNPSEPDGENGWYVSNVTVTLNASDNESGVNITRYRIDKTLWMNYTEPFLLSKDEDDLLIEYFSIDRAGNVEPVQIMTIDIDKTKPVIFLYYEVMGGNSEDGWDILFAATATDNGSGMDRVEFYLDDELQQTVTGAGPDYHWMYHFLLVTIFEVLGFISHLEITDEVVKFFALLVIVTGHPNQVPWFGAYAYDTAGNWDCYSISQPSCSVDFSYGVYLFKDITLPNNYTGHVGRFFIRATFYET